MPQDGSAAREPKPHFHVHLHNRETGETRRVIFHSVEDAKSFFVRIATSPKIDFAELVRRDGKRATVLATHFASGPDGVS